MTRKRASQPKNNLQDEVITNLSQLKALPCHPSKAAPFKSELPEEILHQDLPLVDKIASSQINRNRHPSKFRRKQSNHPARHPN
jgi:hypothetical protein